jgi:Rps23 Pro-64 3,4-dihydroxylase Tpa1-like proline 4-hydroxylase
MLDQEKLDKLSSELSDKYQSQEPYNYIYIDNFFDENTLREIVKVFPTREQLDFYKYDNPLEKKLANDQVEKLPTQISSLLYELSKPTFLLFLEKMTGIEGLIPDPYFRGGGIHQIEKGGKLDIHIDFNIHPKLKLHRRLNVIVFLNENWKEEWNGDFQIWSGHKENDTHILDRLHERVYPLFNRMVVFSTSEKSYHGHPDELMCTDNITRKSIALYYYTATKTTDNEHSTTFVKLPNSNDNLDDLRKERNKGRLNNNIKTNFI